MHSRDKDEVTSQLPLCDRLSLKGKLFELQKKLQLIDLEQKMQEQFPYKPQILSSYELPNRQHDFLENINKAEIIRKVSSPYSARQSFFDKLPHDSNGRSY